MSADNFDLTPEIISRAQSFLAAFWTPIWILAYLIGIILFGAGMMTIAREDNKRGAGLVTVVLGCIMLNLPGFVDMFSAAFLATRAPEALNYVAPGTIPNAGLITLVIRATQFTGLLALIKSLLYFHDYAHEQQSQLLYRACSFFGASLVCMNLPAVLKMFGGFLGVEVQQIINLLL